eukprot:1995917-Prymnesium_polylepis.1
MVLNAAAMQVIGIAGFTSLLGKSHTFDNRADGYARGEAVEVVTCEQAHDSKPTFSGKMHGSAIRQDGRSASLTAPSGQAQQSVLSAALMDGRLKPKVISHLETHGTGTALGDPIETGAIGGVMLSDDVSSRVNLSVGSFKANGGHTEPAAGLAGALNLLVQLQSAGVSPNVHLRILNPHVGAALSGHKKCALCLETASMSTVTGADVSYGGVSSFGYAGTIAHLVVSSAGPEMESSDGVTDSRVSIFKRRDYSWLDLLHPFLQGQLPDDDESTSTVFRVSATSVRALVVDHLIQSQVIFPGAGYFEQARAAISTAFSLASATFQGIFFLMPLVVETPGLSIECSVTDRTFQIRSGVAVGGSELDDAAVHCTGGFKIQQTMRPAAWSSVRAQGVKAAHLTPLFDGCAAVGLQYGPGYRCLEQAWVAGAEAGARMRLRQGSARQGTQVHPADLDGALQLSALTASADGTGEARLPFAVDEARLQSANNEVWANVQNRGEGVANVSLGAFDSELGAQLDGF